MEITSGQSFFCPYWLRACSGIADLRPGELALKTLQRAMAVPRYVGRTADGSNASGLSARAGGVYDLAGSFSIPAAGCECTENVLDAKHFAAIKPGMDKTGVLHLLGRRRRNGRSTFDARDELVWEWRYCDDWHAAARFDVCSMGSRGNGAVYHDIRENCGLAIAGVRKRPFLTRETGPLKKLVSSSAAWSFCCSA